jgi:hypothetical protein
MRTHSPRSVDAHLAAFPNTTLLMLMSGGEMLTYATSGHAIVKS